MTEQIEMKKKYILQRAHIMYYLD